MLSSYNDTSLVPARRVGSFDPVDINFEYKIAGYGFAKDFEIQLDVQNLSTRIRPSSLRARAPPHCRPRSDAWCRLA